MAALPNRPQRLAARALMLGMDPMLTLADRGLHLAHLAAGDQAALELAVRLIEAGHAGDGPRADQAVESLKVGAAILAASRVANGRDQRTGELDRVT